LGLFSRDSVDTVLEVKSVEDESAVGADDICVFESKCADGLFEELVLCCVLKRPSRLMSMDELVEKLSSSEDSRGVIDSVVSVSWVEKVD
jgi:hypothetical protein